MAHESFENAAVAELLNAHFVCIKVDREERPDVDQVYMDAVQMMTGRGGWPLSVFLTPAAEPFFGGTYWPMPGRAGLAGFRRRAAAPSGGLAERRPEVLQQARQSTNHCARRGAGQGNGPVELSRGPALEAAEAALAAAFDPQHGGFGPAPKFPRATDLAALAGTLSPHAARRPVGDGHVSLDRMAAGGIYDHLGGGFHRYSVDDRWLVPHFEKMLYDNAMLAGLYLDAWQVTGCRDTRRVRETLDYLLRDMTDPQGGFYSAEDADSEGEEGKFYLWSPTNWNRCSAPPRRTFAAVYGATAAGNFEGRNILHQPRPWPTPPAGPELRPGRYRTRIGRRTARAAGRAQRAACAPAATIRCW